MKLQRARRPATEEELSSAEAEVGFRFPLGLREYYLRSNGGVPDPYVFRRGTVAVAISECLPLHTSGRGLSGIDAYRTLVLKRKILPSYFFPFAIDGGGNLFLVDCRSEEAAVYVWWHDVVEQNLLDLRIGITGFWSHLKKV